VVIALIAAVCAVLLPLGGKDRPSLRAGTYGTVAGVLSGLAATLTKPTVELLHSGGLGGVLGDWMGSTCSGSQGCSASSSSKSRCRRPGWHRR
jgi:hypothetical protein